MVSFENDYNNGAHPQVMKRLMETNLERCTGYGFDPFCESAKEKIKAACQCPDAQICFLVGGTQTNQVVTSTMLHPTEGVIAAKTGHVSIHEAGAIEYAGHKVLEVEGENGKVRAFEVENLIKTFYADGNYEHMVYPGMVYISHPTELGSLYSKEELTALSNVCKKYDIPLYLDGARLGYGLASKENDVTLPEIAKLVDVFYIGGTKVGALCGEALVFTHQNMPKRFLGQIKQHGALLAKGRVLGVQFDALFTDNLYMEIGRHAMDMAEKMKEIFKKKGYEFYLQSPTNQQYIVVDNKKKAELEKSVAFSFWENIDENHTAIRFVTSWCTTEEDLKVLESVL